MKKSVAILTIALAGVLWAGTANAQGLSLGVKGGLNVSKFGGDDAAEGTIDPSNRTGFAVGGFANIGFGQVFAVQPEFLYSQRGAKYEGGGTALGEVKVSYIEIPLLAVISPALAGAPGVRPFFMAGPVASIKVGCSIDSVDCEDDTIEDTDLGLAFGAGAGIAAGRGTFLIDGRYGLGLASISTDDAVDIKNQGFSIMLGYSFPLGR